MRLVSPFLKHAVYPALQSAGWLKRIAPSNGCAVLNYHGVIPPNHHNGDVFLDGNLIRPEILQSQLQFLKLHFNIVHPEDFRGWIEHGHPLPQRSLLITCDDGLLNALTDMLPVLKSENVPCLFFVTSASCGRTPGMLWYEELYDLMRDPAFVEKDLPLPSGENQSLRTSKTLQAKWWHAVRNASRLSASARSDWMARVREACDKSLDYRSEQRWRLLDGEQLNKIAVSGMTIGAHTRTHPVLSLCSEDEARHEIKHGKTELENALGRPVWAFAYPFGNPATMGEREIRLARESGYSCAFLNVEQWGDGSRDAFRIPRTHVTRDSTLPELTAHLTGLHLRLQRAVGA